MQHTIAPNFRWANLNPPAELMESNVADPAILFKVVVGEMVQPENYELISLPYRNGLHGEVNKRGYPL